MFVSKVSVAILLINGACAVQVETQAQLFDHKPEDTFQALRDQIAGRGSLPENAELAEHLFGDVALTWDMVEAATANWEAGFSGGTDGSNSGSIVGKSGDYILKSESKKFYDNFKKIKSKYYERAAVDASCLQKVRFIFKTTGILSNTYWFVIVNSNSHAAERTLMGYDMKASRQIGKDSGYAGGKGQGFTDDFFYMKEMQSWTFTDAVRNIRTALKADLKMFIDAWDAVQLVDYSILIFINSLPANGAYHSPRNCVRLTRVDPETGDVEGVEMCFAIIDFFAHFSTGKSLAQRKGETKVYSTGEKFGSHYGGALQWLVDDILVDHTRTANLGAAYIPQARTRHGLAALKAAAEFKATSLENRRAATYVNFSHSYYDLYPQGLPTDILELLWDISELGLSTRNNNTRNKYEKALGLNLTLHLTSDSKWNAIERALAIQGAAGVDALDDSSHILELIRFDLFGGRQRR